jgi:peptidoglycan/LPS O-acetylase OafA/YrhL
MQEHQLLKGFRLIKYIKSMIKFIKKFIPFKQSGTEYITIINSLRGLAALGVCVFHLVCFTPYPINNIALYDFFFYGKKGVEVFFIISGIVIPLSLYKYQYKLSQIVFS